MAATAETRPGVKEDLPEGLDPNMHVWEVSRFAKEPLPETLKSVVEDIENLFALKWHWQVDKIWAKQTPADKKEQEYQPVCSFFTEGPALNSAEFITLSFRLTTKDKVPQLRVGDFFDASDRKIDVAKNLDAELRIWDYTNPDIYSLADKHALKLFPVEEEARAGLFPFFNTSPVRISQFSRYVVSSDLHPYEKIENTLFVRVELENLITKLKSEEKTPEN